MLDESESLQTSAPAPVVREHAANQVYRLGRALFMNDYVDMYEVHLVENRAQHLLKEVDGGDDEIWQEIGALNAVRGDPRAVTLHCIFSTEYFTQIALDFLQAGNLTQRIVLRGRLQESAAQQLFASVAQVLSHLHTQGWAHRDVKTDAILMLSTENDSECKLSMNGAAIRMSDACGKEPMPVRGSEGFMAPEVIGQWGTTQDLPATDVWGLGCVLHTMLCGALPFGSDKESRILTKQCHLDLQNPNWEGVSQPAKELVAAMLVRAPGDRLTLAECLQHPWLQHTPPTLPGPHNVKASSELYQKQHQVRNSAMTRFAHKTDTYLDNQLDAYGKKRRKGLQRAPATPVSQSTAQPAQRVQPEDQEPRSGEKNKKQKDSGCCCVS